MEDKRIRRCKKGGGRVSKWKGRRARKKAEGANPERSGRDNAAGGRGRGRERRRRRRQGRRGGGSENVAAVGKK